ncbi:DNA cytosine methyltransferase [Exiguobacterium artemiae]|uniref:DNA cytosine methyltransferase n=1 Tax=Exiguobacterium artemiae TaxID=340145 RepID=UPI0029646491|nr:DNA cytosine methyltransferase [Exiguobacterium sibiricum]MDW2885764.1 DNA cytosine methyltransferase [Exiguobacterium sibiricum]
MNSESQKIKLIDLFAGAGGLSNGFLQTGNFEVIGAVEINKDAKETYILNHNRNKDIIITAKDSSVSDISQIDFKPYATKNTVYTKDIVVIGGPPCQGFSNANRQKNYLISGNNQLVKEFARAVYEIKPVAFLMENVKTMNSKTHKFFVTHHVDDSIYAYSSIKHLESINKNMVPFWNKDELVLLETKNIKEKNLIKQALNLDIKKTTLLKHEYLSRLKSIVKKLKKQSSISINKIEAKEIKNIVIDLRSLLASNIILENDIKKLFVNTAEILELILSEDKYDNKTTLNTLILFLEINQLVRYRKELLDEKILTLGEINIDGVENYKVSVEVFSYSIVEYLFNFFGSLGYNLTSDVLNSNDFFVPQKRHRFIFMGLRNEVCISSDISLPKSKNNIIFTVEDAIKDLYFIQPNKNVSDNELIYDVKNDETTMQSYYRSGSSKNVIYNHVNTDSEPLSKKRFEEISDKGGGNFHSLSDELKNITYADASRTQNTIYLKLDGKKASPTVVNVRKSMWQHPNKAEAISIREAARLQSFRDNYIFVGSKDKQYQQIGNAVPPLLARSIAETMLVQMGITPVNLLKEEFVSK